MRCQCCEASFAGLPCIECQLEADIWWDGIDDMSVLSEDCLYDNYGSEAADWS